MKRYENQVAIVTGGAGGIGTKICERLAAEGVRVAVLDLREADAQTLAAKLPGAMGLGADTTNEAAIAEAVAKVESELGPVNVLVNNVGGTTKLLRVDTTALEDWTKEVQLNLSGTFNCTKAVLPGMVARKHGVIVNISSINGMAFFANPAYSAAKAGVINFTKTVAVQYGPDGIRCNAVCPGTILVDSPRYRQRLEAFPDLEAKMAAWYPVGRVGKPEDVASAVAFLGSEEASFISGSSLVVDGALTSGYPEWSRSMNPERH